MMPTSEDFDTTRKSQGLDVQAVATPRNQNLPLSYIQERLWLVEQLIPGAHSCYSAIQLTGKLDIEALESSLSEIIRRHESLRTNFKAVHGQPVQMINRPKPFSIAVVNLEEIPENERESQVLSSICENRQRPFELDRDLLIRGTLLRLDEENCALILTWHYMICDGWSAGILSRELEDLYGAFSAGKPSPLRELSTQYADFAYWQRHQPVTASQKALLSYWMQQLEGDLPLLQLPTDHLPATRGFQSERQSLLLSNSLSTALKELSQYEGITLSVLLLATFKTLLYRYTEQPDIIVGYPIANRSRVELKDLIGCFLNHLPLRTHLTGTPTFRELLGRLQQVMIEAYAHQDLPSELMLKQAKPGQYQRYDWPFQVAFAHQEVHFEAPKLPGLTTKLIDYWDMPEKLDLTLCTVDTGSELELTLGYNADLFDRVMVKRMLQHLDALLQGIVKNPDERISTLPILSEEERRLLLVQWNNTHVNYPKDLCLHQHFEAQVERTPDNIAVVCEDVQLTYQELNRRANQLAHLLLELGVSPGEFVGLCLKSSAEIAIGILGILKVGGACLLLNPALPQERRQFMLEDAKVTVVLTQNNLLESLLKYEVKVVNFDQIGKALSKKSEENLDSRVMADHAACVAYTSGSTGAPKGVVQTHRCASSPFFPETALYRLTEADGFLITTYNNLMPDIFWAWLSGARAIISNDEGYRDSAYLVTLIAEQHVTFACFFVSMLQMLLEEEDLDSCDSLRHVISMGEPLSVDLQERFFARLTAQLYNAYGQAEAGSTIWKCERGSNRGFVPVGRPAANVQVYLLDAYLQPVPISVPGEIFISSASMAQEYLNRPDLTREKFIPNPFSNEPGAVLCKTGDFGRYLPDGNIEFLGRKDHQVKIRGFRVEPGEIEAVLSRHPAVRKTAVIAREDVPGNKRLVAYVVPVQEQTPTISELRRFLKEKLPDYMVPAAFVLLEALPLTLNGKVDLLALPAPNQTRPELENRFIAPRNPIEQEIADIWADVLGLEQVGIHDNFFDLGGHSLIATQVVSRVRNIFQLELALSTLFESPTVFGLATSIEMYHRIKQAQQTSPLRVGFRNGDLPLSFAQHRLWFLDQLEPYSSFYNMPIDLRLLGQLDTAALEHSLNEIIHRHESIRTTFPSVDGHPLQLITPDEHISLSLLIIDLSKLSASQLEAEISHHMTTEAQQPFDLANDLLLRAKLLRLAEEEHILLVTTHHIASDGWSMGVFIHELAALYVSFSTGKPSLLPALPIQYADFALWQRQWLQGEVLQRQLNYWKEQLLGMPALLELPTDHPRLSVQTYRGKSHFFVLPTSLTEALHELSKREGVTLFMMLLAAFQTLLARYSQQQDIVVGSPIANRTHTEIEGLIGFFVNTLVLRANLSGNPSFHALLARTREVTLGAYAHQDLPFEKLVEELQPERDLSRNPLFQVMFVLHNAPVEALELPGLTVQPMELESGTALFDLTLNLKETAEGLSSWLEYNADLFEPATIERMAKHFQTLLEGIVAAPEQRLSDLPLLTEAEFHQLSVEWNETQADYPEMCIHELVEAQVERTPNAVAVVYEDRQLTYQELNMQANQLAHYLQTLGVGPDVLVGICVERSNEMVMGLLSILKASGAYVPLDPRYPPDRLAFMLTDSQVGILVTQQSLQRQFDGYTGRIICLDTDQDCLVEQANTPTVAAAHPDCLAYVIYTSGSTGHPKGVMISHRNVLNFIAGMDQRLAAEPPGTWLAVTSISFDISVLELFWTLARGFRVIVQGEKASSTTLSHIGTIGAQIDHYTVSHMQCTPSLAKMLASDPQVLNAMQKIRQLMLGGEAWPASLAEQLRGVVSGELLNMYGPTETTIWSTAYTVREVESTIPIGRPIANTQIYILDQDIQPVPSGVPGDLYIGGEGVARGYLRQPGLTAEKFIPDPFSARPGTRLYKTGDRAQYLPTGDIRYLGRSDAQVKLRGFRIELEEIEVVLTQHPSVREVVVLMQEGETSGPEDTLRRNDVPLDKRLVAYVEPSSLDAADAVELRRFLSQKLPTYMLPSTFVFLEQLPLTANGKVDRRALPALNTVQLALENGFVAPRNPIEEVLVGIWAELLDVEQIGIHDDFFELGGHSLLATQLISRLRNAFQVELPVRSVFEAPTIEELAAVIEEILLEEVEELSEEEARRLASLERRQ